MAKRKFGRVSLISQLNIFRLVYRLTLFLVAGGLYAWYKITNIQIFNNIWVGFWILLVIVVLLAVEMIERFFPVKTSSMGSQKQFKRNYLPSGQDKPILQSWKATMTVVISWVALNLVFGVLYFFKIFDSGAMMLIALFYAVSDMICILFFCPFQTWMMHNRCCGTCRIYNWDFIMMATPLVSLLVIPGHFNVFNNMQWEWAQWYIIFNPFIYILVGLSLALFIRWEVTYRRHPERFSDKTNMNIRCVNCKEKLCAHKKQLQVLLRESGKLIRGFYDAESVIKEDENDKEGS